MADSIVCTIAPTGGIVTIQMVSADTTGTWTLTRAPTADLSAITTLYSGVPLIPPNGEPMWLDIGDGLNGPLDPQTSYTYIFTTSSGSVSQAVTPAGSILLQYDDFLRIMVAVIRAGIQSLVLPPTSVVIKNKPTVYIAMPLTGEPPLPAVSIYEAMLAQEGDEVPIGHGMNLDQTYNAYQVDEIVFRRYVITIMASTVDERDYWKTAIIAMYKTILIPILLEWGQDIRSSFQAASSQVMKSERSPGFYFADVSLQFSGIFAVRVLTNYPVVETFEFIANGKPLAIPPGG